MFGIIDILLNKNKISKEHSLEIRKELKDGRASLDKILIKYGVSPDDILYAKGEYLNIPIRIIGNHTISGSILENIPEDSARHYNFVPIGLKDKILEVGIVDPDNIEARDALNFISTKIGLPFKLFLISQSDFESVLEQYKGLSGEVSRVLSDLESELSGEAVENTKNEDEDENETRIVEEAPVTKIMATIVRYAIEGSASDIHIEHLSDKVRVRFRVDGTLATSLILPTKVHSALVARVKILCNMKLDEKRKPQDGRFTTPIDGRKIDFRVSTFPAYYGEKVVIRILDQEKGVKKLSEVGMETYHLEMVKRAITKPYGIILITGPTGSGKSTTLYSMLNELDREGSNVMSLEDPVEYSIDGISQSQMQPEIGYNFASGLRTSLRQDPDVIMVGEIRDKETAQLAIQAALTGHLVLSTIHTNNSAGVIPRLIDMGVDPYLIAPTLILTIGQRLVRNLCPDSGKRIEVEGSVKMMLEKQFENLPEKYKNSLPKIECLYGIDVSATCPNGTRGRSAVFEMFEMDKDLEEIILKDGTEFAVSKAIRAKGVLSMKEHAIIKCARREVPLEEVNTL